MAQFIGSSVDPQRNVLIPQEEWDSSVRYSIGSYVYDRGGVWRAVTRNTDSQPVSGNTDWAFVGGSPYIDVTLSPVDLTTAPYMNPNVVIASVDQGTKTFGFTTLGPYGISLSSGTEIVVIGSTGNDGTYTVTSATATTVVVAEAIPDGTVDGLFSLADPGILVMDASSSGTVALPIALQDITGVGNAFASDSAADIYQSNDPTTIFFALNDDLNGSSAIMPRLQVVDGVSQIINANINLVDTLGGAWKIWSSTDVTNGGATIGTRSVTHRIYYTLIDIPAGSTFFAISAVNQGTKTFTVSPSPVSILTPPETFSIVGSTGNNGTYTALAVTATTIRVKETVPSSTGDGWAEAS